ncbi:hypothetical protein ACOMHN_027581 [Nucella lapillus]
MFLAGVLWIWAFTTTAIPALQISPPSLSPLVSRLERLEGLVADHRAQWQRANRDLQADIRTLLKEKRAMRGEMESLQLQIQELTTENQALNTELGGLRQ